MIKEDATHFFNQTNLSGLIFADVEMGQSDLSGGSPYKNSQFLAWHLEKFFPEHPNVKYLVKCLREFSSPVTAKEMQARVFNLPAGQRYLMHGGWDLHCILYEFYRRHDGLFDLAVYNTGGGVTSFHPHFQGNNGKTQIIPRILYEEVLPSSFGLFDTLETSWIDWFAWHERLRLGQGQAGRPCSAIDVYEASLGHLLDRRVIPKNSRWIGAQRGGTCSWRAFLPLVAETLQNDQEYAHWKLSLELTAIHAMRSCPSLSKKDQMVLEIGLKNIQRFLEKKRVDCLSEADIIGISDQVEAISAELKTQKEFLRLNETTDRDWPWTPCEVFPQQLPVRKAIPRGPSILAEKTVKESVFALLGESSLNPEALSFKDNVDAAYAQLERLQGNKQEAMYPLGMDSLLRQTETIGRSALRFNPKDLSPDHLLTTAKSLVHLMAVYAFRRKTTYLPFEMNTQLALLVAVHKICTHIDSAREQRVLEKYGIEPIDYKRRDRYMNFFTQIRPEEANFEYDLRQYFSVSKGQRQSLFDFERIQWALQRNDFKSHEIQIELTAAKSYFSDIENGDETFMSVDDPHFELLADPSQFSFIPLEYHFLREAAFLFYSFLGRTPLLENRKILEHLVLSVDSPQRGLKGAIFGSSRFVPQGFTALDRWHVMNQSHSLDGMFQKWIQESVFTKRDPEAENVILQQITGAPFFPWLKTRDATIRVAEGLQPMKSFALIDPAHFDRFKDEYVRWFFEFHCFQPYRSNTRLPLVDECWNNPHFLQQCKRWLTQGLHFVQTDTTSDLQQKVDVELFFLRIALHLRKISPKFDVDAVVEERLRALASLELVPEVVWHVSLHYLSFLSVATLSDERLQIAMTHWLKVIACQSGSSPFPLLQKEAEHWVASLAADFKGLLAEKPHLLTQCLQDLIPGWQHHCQWDATQFPLYRDLISPVAVHLLSGVFTLDGMAPFRLVSLPRHIIESVDYLKLFGETVYPAYRSGEEYHFSHPQYGGIVVNGKKIFKVLPDGARLIFESPTTPLPCILCHSPYTCWKREQDASFLFFDATLGKDCYRYDTTHERLYLQPTEQQVTEQQVLLLPSQMTDVPGIDKCAMLEMRGWIHAIQNVESGEWVSLIFPRLISLNGTTLSFVAKDEAWAWSDEPDFVLVETPYGSLFPNLPNSLQLVHRITRQKKLIMSLEKMQTNQHYEPIVYLDQPWESLEYDKAAERPWIVYDVQETGDLMPQTLEGELFLVYLALAGRDYEKGHRLVQTLSPHRSHSVRSLDIVNWILKLSDLNFDTSALGAASFLRMALYLEIAQEGGIHDTGMLVTWYKTYLSGIRHVPFDMQLTPEEITWLEGRGVLSKIFPTYPMDFQKPSVNQLSLDQGWSHDRQQIVLSSLIHSQDWITEVKKKLDQQTPTQRCLGTELPTFSFFELFFDYYFLFVRTKTDPTLLTQSQREALVVRASLHAARDASPPLLSNCLLVQLLQFAISSPSAPTLPESFQTINFSEWFESLLLAAKTSEIQLPNAKPLSSGLPKYKAKPLSVPAPQKTFNSLPWRPVPEVSQTMAYPLPFQEEKDLFAFGQLNAKLTRAMQAELELFWQDYAHRPQKLLNEPPPPTPEELQAWIGQCQQQADVAQKQWVQQLMMRQPFQKLLLQRSGVSPEVTEPRVLAAFRSSRREERLAELNPYLQPQEISELIENISMYLQYKTDAEHLQRVRDGQELYQKRGYDPTEHPALLALEFQAHIRLRKEQVDRIFFMTKEKQGHYLDGVVQLGMGKGKTFIANSYLAADAANLADLLACPEDHSPFYICIVPAAQFQSMREGLIHLQKKRFDQEVIPLELTRANMNETTLTSFLNALQRSANRRDALLIQKTTVQSLQLEFLYRILQNQECQSDPCIPLLQTILCLFRRQGDVLLDEIDVLLNTKVEVNFPIGQARTLQPQAIYLLQSIYHGLMPRLLKQEKISSEEYWKDLLPAIAEKLARESGHLLLEKDHLDSFIRFVSGQHLPAEDPFILYLRALNISNPEAAQLIFMSQQFFSQILPMTLLKKLGSHYGRVSTGNMYRVKPYLGVDSPAPTEFANPWEAAAYEFQATLLRGVDFRWVHAWHAEMWEKAKLELNAKGALSLDETSAGRECVKMTGYTLQTLHQDLQQDAAAVARSLPIEIALRLTAELIYRQVTWHSEYLSSNGHNFVNQFRSVRGHSGTPWNLPSYKKELRDRFFPDLGSNGEITEKLLQNPPLIHHVASDLPQDILRTAMKGGKQIHGLIDAAGFFHNYTTRETAEQLLHILLHNGSPLKQVVYFDRKEGSSNYTPDHPTALRYDETRKAYYTVLLSTTNKESLRKLSVTPDNSFFYYDELHTEATDFAQQDEAINLLTFDEKVTHRTLFQAWSRLRKARTGGQRAEFVIHEKTAARLPDQGKTWRGILYSAIDNEAKKKEEAVFDGLRQQIREQIRQEVMALLEILQGNDLHRVAKELKQFLVSTNDQTFDLERLLAPQVTAQEAVLSLLDTFCEKLRSDPLLTNETKGKIIFRFKALAQEIQTELSMWLTHSVTAGKAHEVTQGQEMELALAQEVAVEQEQMVEQVADQELQKDIERYSAYHGQATIEFNWDHPLKDLPAKKMPNQSLPLGEYLTNPDFYSKKYKDLFSSDIFVTQNWMNTLWMPIPYFSNQHKKVDQLLIVVQPSGELYVLIVSAREGSYLKKCLDTSPERYAKSMWLILPNGDEYTAHAHSDLTQEQVEKLQQILWQMQLLNGNIGELLGRQKWAPDYTDEQRERVNHFCARAAEQPIRRNLLWSGESHDAINPVYEIAENESQIRAVRNLGSQEIATINHDLVPHLNEMQVPFLTKKWQIAKLTPRQLLAVTMEQRKDLTDRQKNELKGALQNLAPCLVPMRPVSDLLLLSTAEQKRSVSPRQVAQFGREHALLIPFLETAEQITAVPSLHVRSLSEQQVQVVGNSPKAVQCECCDRLLERLYPTTGMRIGLIVMGLWGMFLSLFAAQPLDQSHCLALGRRLLRI